MPILPPAVRPSPSPRCRHPLPSASSRPQLRLLLLPSRPPPLHPTRRPPPPPPPPPRLPRRPLRTTPLRLTILPWAAPLRWLRFVNQSRWPSLRPSHLLQPTLRQSVSQRHPRLGTTAAASARRRGPQLPTRPSLCPLRPPAHCPPRLSPRPSPLPAACRAPRRSTPLCSL